MTSLNAARQRLTPLSNAFATDGYTLVIRSFEEGRLDVIIEASADACAECLVPKSMMINIIQTHMGDFGGIRDITIVYPTEVG